MLILGIVFLLLYLGRYAYRQMPLGASVRNPTDLTGNVHALSADLRPRMLLSPPDGAYVDNPSPLRDFEHPQTVCLQEGFGIELSPDPDFATDALRATLGPATEYETTVNFLADCMLYCWRAKAVFGEDISGPYSAVSAFYTDFAGACAPHTGLPRSAGVVWQDMCVPGDGGTPPGCVWQEGGLAPDGAFARMPKPPRRVSWCASPRVPAPLRTWAGSPGRRMLRAAACRSSSPARTACGSSETRMGTSPCEDPAGGASHPPGGNDSPVRYEIVIDWGEERPDLDFAWWNCWVGGPA